MPNYLEHMPLYEVIVRAVVAAGLPILLMGLVALLLDPVRGDGEKKYLDKRRRPW